MTELFKGFLLLLDIILSSKNPPAALERARVAAETEALNFAADEALKRL